MVSGGLLAACGKDKTAAEPSTKPSASTTSSVSSTPSASASGSTTPSASASSTAKAKTITNLDEIKVNGGFGVKPAVTGPWPLQVAKTTNKVVVPGKGGLVVEEKGTVEVNYVGLNARTGKTFDSSFDAKKTATFPLDGVVAGFRKGLTGTKVGDRVLIVMTGPDGYPDGQADVGIEKGDNLVFVVDVISTSVSKPTGSAVTPPAGLPTVKDNGTKAPTVTIGSAAKPTTTTVQPLIKGEGAKVKAADAVLIKYTCVAWSTGKVLVENYTTGAESAALASLIPAWKKGLDGQTIGSRMLIVSTPEDAYPKGNETPKIPAGETLVYVVDLLFAGDAGA